MLHTALALGTILSVALGAPERLLDRPQKTASPEAAIHLSPAADPEDLSADPSPEYRGVDRSGDRGPGDHERLQKRSPAYDFGLGKRAYSYVSEYKRLPVYNFGLGKRSRLYSFGLGKRSVDAAAADDVGGDSDAGVDEWTLTPAQEQLLEELADRYELDDDDVFEEKRARPYSFGLGKRSMDDLTDQDKRARLYEFGLGKRSDDFTDESKRAHLYEFGLGKRTDEMTDQDKRTRLYEFGLGKRAEDSADDIKRARLYKFGLGKRAEDSADDIKRAHMYEFGLGKRAPYYNFGLGKRLPGRSYSFGLGKRLSPGKFSFGLGKRERDVNRFNFGLGKRSGYKPEETDNETDP